MQTSLMFFDLPSQGLFPDIDKIAIKMPKGQEEMDACDCGGFADIINALMSSVPADELQQSLDQLEWVSSEEGDDAGLVPLLDLTKDQSKAIGVAKQLLNEAAPEVFMQAESLKSVLVPAQAQSDILEGKTQTETGENNVAGRLLSFLKASDERVRHVPETWRIPPAQDKIPDDEVQSEQVLKPVPKIKKPDTPVDPMAGVNAEKTKPSIPDVLQGNGTPVAKHPVEGLERENPSDGGEKKATSMSLLQQLKGQLTSEESPDQQLADDSKKEAELLAKDNPKTRSGVGTHVRDFKPGIVDSSTETTTDSNHFPTKAGSGNLASLHGAVSRMKASAGERMEVIGGGKEMNPTPAQDMQTHVVRQIVQQMTLRSRGSQSTMTIKLKPEFLGQVHMQISTDHHQVTVRMATESMAVKEMVEQGLQHLKTELQQQGLEIHKFDVFVANDNESHQHGQDWAGFRQNLKRRQRQGLNQNADGNGEGEEASITRDAGGRASLDTVGEVNYFA